MSKEQPLWDRDKMMKDIERTLFYNDSSIQLGRNELEKMQDAMRKTEEGKKENSRVK